MRLKRLREEKSITQQKLADFLGLTQQAINNYENLSNEPDYETLCRIASFFDVSTDYLLEHSEIRQATTELTTHKLSETESEFIRLLRALPEEYQNIQLVAMRWIAGNMK